MAYGPIIAFRKTIALKNVETTINKFFPTPMGNVNKRITMISIREHIFIIFM